MKALCNKCINYEDDEVSARCILKMWPKVTLSKSKIYNAMMFECIDHERESYIYPINQLEPLQHS